MAPRSGGARLTVPVGEGDHVRGPASAPVTLVEYGDFECPYTRRARPVVERLGREFGDELRFAFRNFPLTGIHPHAQAAAEAAEAAGSQGRFWQMHDLLFANQRHLEGEDLKRYASELGLDPERFGRDLAEGVHAHRVREDFEGGLESGVQGTPTFYINGVRHEGSYDLETLRATIERARGFSGDPGDGDPAGATSTERAEEVLGFWFGTEDEPGFDQPREVWFSKNEGFDREIRERFAGDHERAAAGQLDHWKEEPRTCLALILLLDQVPRNLFRGAPRSFASDEKALAAARHAVGRGFDRELTEVMRWFIYLPFEHSEDLEDQHRSVELFRSLGNDPDSVYVTEYAVRHREIVERFGRFPHRNVVLGRPSTPGEVEFLKEPGSSF